MGPQPLRVDFRLPQSELKRAASDAGSGPEGSRLPGDFDRTHFYGEVTFEVDAPLAADVVLDQLRRSGKIDTTPPLRIKLEQPVAYLLAQLAGAMVLARHGEGEPTIPLAGGKGAITVAHEQGRYLLGLPLGTYAGVAEIPEAAAAAAVAASCASLAKMLRRYPWTATWPATAFLEREPPILLQDANWRPLEEGEATADWLWPIAQGASKLEAQAQLAEAHGAHVVPYWKASPGTPDGVVSFEPLKAPGRGDRAGALALLLFPFGERLLQAGLAEDPDGEASLRSRLRRRAPFSATFAKGHLVKVTELASELPMA